QREHLARLLAHAYENVPYYRRVFRERQLVPEDIREIADLQNLPFLTKELIQENLRDLRAQNYPDYLFEYVTTGGSTGVPVGFFYEKGASRAREWAFMKTQWERVGYSFSDRCVILRGYVVESAQDGVFWKKALFGRWLIMSSHHMTDEHLPGYIEKIREFRPKFIQAYPSTAVILARYMKEHGLEPFASVKAILCGSENLYPWQRELLEDAFRCRVYSWYGNSEQTVLAGECEKSTCYHIFPEYGIVELIGKDSLPVTGEGEVGEVIATNLHNYVCPLIRYRTMDLAVPSSTPCACGRAYPLLKYVEGRLQDFIITAKGQLLSGITMNIDTDAFDNVRQFQFYQERQGEVILNIVKTLCYTDRDTEYIYREVSRSCGDDVTITIRFVDAIPRTASGKHRYFVQTLPIRTFDDLEGQKYKPRFVDAYG
ncbi:MAG: phenylacetate--CoA ligase family protein, partial [Methanomicrobiaceae archaeon]|nr:phenylacetate--CoA ligase family protein [Methanomicrobiaceae archaeon]